jgi:hypothetical protein
MHGGWLDTDLDEFENQETAAHRVTAYSFEVCDSLLNIGPCGQVAMGEPAFLSEEFAASSPDTPDIELVTTSGHGNYGAEVCPAAGRHHVRAAWLPGHVDGGQRRRRGGGARLAHPQPAGLQHGATDRPGDQRAGQFWLLHRRPDRLRCQQDPGRHPDDQGHDAEADDQVRYLEEKILKVIDHFKSKGKKLELFMIVFPFKAGFLYGKIKQLCVVIKCFLNVNVFAMHRPAPPAWGRRGTGGRQGGLQDTQVSCRLQIWHDVNPSTVMTSPP